MIFLPVASARNTDLESATRIFSLWMIVSTPSSHDLLVTAAYTQVKEYVRQARPTPVTEPIVRFETVPARQAQVDFAEFRLPFASASRYW
jgi:hypothetical protein